MVHLLSGAVTAVGVAVVWTVVMLLLAALVLALVWGG